MSVEEQVTFHGLPERLDVADELVLRRITPDDLPAVVAATNATLDTLRPWMPWAQQPLTLESQREWLAETSEMWRTGTGFNWGVFDSAGQVVGAIGFHVRNGPGVLEIGYWLGSAYEGRGLMTRAAQALTELARAVEGVVRVEIHCDAGNVRSAAIPRRLGYTLVDTREVERDAPAATGRQQIWSIDV